jgi:hypothetical protein
MVDKMGFNPFGTGLSEPRIGPAADTPMVLVPRNTLEELLAACGKALSAPSTTSTAEQVGTEHPPLLSIPGDAGSGGQAAKVSASTGGLK